MKDHFGKEEPLIFYYPSVQGTHRDNRAIEVLLHFTNSVMLFEKPSHSTESELIEFKERCLGEGIDTCRIMIG